jgi:hypothetical protein
VTLIVPVVDVLDVVGERGIMQRASIVLVQCGVREPDGIRLRS